MTRVKDHQSPSEQAGNAMLDAKDAEIKKCQATVNELAEREIKKCQAIINAQADRIFAQADRVLELLQANNRFEQRGRMAERLVRFLESTLLDGNFGPTREAMARHLILEYRKDFPRDA